MTSIHHYTFSFNQYIEEIIIPVCVVDIKSNAFSSSPKLTKIVFEGKSEPTNCHERAFYSSPETLVINVPSDYEGDTFCNKKVTKQKSIN